MTGEVIKSFLVGLGFDVDDSSLSKFNKALTSATVKVTALYGAVNVLAAGIFKSISGISSGFEQMGYDFRLIAPMINKALVLRQELLKAYGAAGINLGQAIRASIRFNMSLAKTQFALKAIYTSVGLKFLPLLTKQMEIFRNNIYANMPKIQAALERFIKLIFTAFDAVTILGKRAYSILSRVYDFFVTLDNATNGWSSVIFGLIAAWRLLNLSFLATPLGLLLTGFLAILALYDDFKTFTEGGKSLFNWGPIVPIVNALTVAISGLFSAAKAVVELFSSGFGDQIAPQLQALKHFAEGIASAFSGVATAIDLVVRDLGGGVIGKLLDFRDKVEAGIFGGGPSTQSVPAVSGNPLGSNIANQPQTNQHVQQQTSINIVGSADANSTGRAVAGEQGRVNQDMARNMKSAAR